MNGLQREWSGKVIQIYTKQKYVRRIEGGGVFGGYDGGGILVGHGVGGFDTGL